MMNRMGRVDAKAFFDSVCGDIKWRGTQGSCRCPLPTHGSSDRRCSFSVNFEKGTFICHKENISGGLKKLAQLLGVPSPFQTQASLHLIPVPAGNPARIEATYDYVDAEGKLLYQTVRYAPKDFRQRRPDPAKNGRWVWNLDNTTPVPYRLPGLLAAFAAQEPVFVVEGEKDADRLVDLGLTATTNHGGALKWNGNHSRHFPAGAKVFLLPDADAPGQKHMRSVHSSLKLMGCEVQWIRLAGLPDKGDVSDWLAQGHTKDELLALTSNDANAGDFPLTDVGNAERLAQRHQDKIRHCGELNKWFVWDGRHWEEDVSGGVCRLAIETVRHMRQSAKDFSGNKQRKSFESFAVKCESEARLRAMISLAAAQVPLVVRRDELDARPWLFNAGNGIVDLKAGVLLPHDPANLLTKLTRIDYDEAAAYPVWEAFLRRVLGGREDLLHYVQKAVGYSLTGLTSEQCLFMLYGHGANGKSTFLSTLSALFDGYAGQLAMESLLMKQNEGIPNDIAALCGSRFVVSSEGDEGRRLAESKIKQMTGEDALPARFMRGEWFRFLPAFKLWMGTNHKPTIRGSDEAIWRRIRLIPFTETIGPAERDPYLKDKLKDELPGILRWAVEGCRLWQQEGLTAPDDVVAATGEYRQEMDIIGDYMKERFVQNPLCAVKVSESYKDYEQWCAANSERPLSKRMFVQKLRDRGLKTKQGSHNQTYWDCLALAEYVVDGDAGGEMPAWVNQVNRVNEIPVNPTEKIQSEMF